MWYPSRMPNVKSTDFFRLYEHFQAPITKLNCGKKCAPYNEKGVPFCCDIQHAVPTAYQVEWEYLISKTDLWHLWKPNNSSAFSQLRAQTPPDQVLIECLGHTHCQREYRSITCRAFPFFPYINEQGKFVGLSYYGEYEDRCWIISNLQFVSPQYRIEFTKAYDILLELIPIELENFKYQTSLTRRTFEKQGRAVPLLHRNGYNYKVSPRSERMRRIHIEDFSKYGPYKVAVEMPFPDEAIHQ